ncbi:baseplate wedge tail fiber connector [Vibrio phage nt-1]|uniref:Baseplate wedge tail fiber connector n=1 Tax=Vibrio phage nt-1 TaxID=115992 RepID=R9TIV1_9CAUD|nr:baseplate wedge tail fiber protein connector [Vibrio phage nt-1]AGN30017.1 baseplate wedge tail fiber connector [Vibrio phage nt-1]
MGRQRLETGTAGSVGTGDTIHNGGNKLRDNSDEFYHINADFELTDAGENYIPAYNDNAPRPHAGGYWNRIPPSSTAGGSGGPNNTNLLTSIVTGGKYDIDTSALGGGASMTLNLPKIGTSAGQAKRGERIEFQNTTATLDTNPITIQASAGDAIVSASELNGTHIVRTNYCHIVCTVIDDGTGLAGTPQWGIKINPLVGDFSAPVNDTIFSIPDTVTATMPLFDILSFASCKLMVYAENSDPLQGGAVTRRMTSEILLLNNITDVYIDEYSVVNTDKEFGNLILIEPRVDNGVIVLDITSNDDNVSIAIKSIETIRLS